jgi:N-acetylmuramoyl-L-alanine amidase
MVSRRNFIKAMIGVAVAGCGEEKDTENYSDYVERRAEELVKDRENPVRGVFRDLYETMKDGVNSFGEKKRRASGLEENVGVEMPGVVRKYNEVIVLDAGHGGKDPGAVFPFETSDKAALYLEKKVTLLQAQKTKGLLEENGYKNVILVRDEDVYSKPGARVDFARGLKADLYLSFHTDSVTDTSVRGQTTYFCDGSESVRFAKIIQSELLEEIGRDYGTKDRGVRKKGYIVLKENGTAALIESGFSSNDGERWALKNNSDHVAKAAYEAIHGFYGRMK